MEPINISKVPTAHFITVRQAKDRYDLAGVGRTEKAIQQYCKNGTLTKTDELGPNGKTKFFIDPKSVDDHIAQLKQLHSIRNNDYESEAFATGSEPSQPVANTDATSQPVANKIAVPNVESADPAPVKPSQPVATGSEPSQPVAKESDDLITKYVEQLQLRIDEKDELIKVLRTQLDTKDTQLVQLNARFQEANARAGETNSIFAALQRMLAKLMGQSDPYAAALKTAENITPERTDEARDR